MGILNVDVYPHLVECNLICKVELGKMKVEETEPVFLFNLTLEDFQKAMSLLNDFKASQEEFKI